MTINPITVTVTASSTVLRNTLNGALLLTAGYIIYRGGKYLCDKKLAEVVSGDTADVADTPETSFVSKVINPEPKVVSPKAETVVDVEDDVLLKTTVATAVTTASEIMDLLPVNEKIKDIDTASIWFIKDKIEVLTKACPILQDYSHLMDTKALNSFVNNLSKLDAKITMLKDGADTSPSEIVSLSVAVYTDCKHIQDSL